MATIRRLTIQDSESFFPLFENLVKEEIPEIKGEQDFFLKSDYSKERVAASLSYPRTVIMGAFDKSNNLIGFLWGNKSYAGLGFISWLMVENGHRNTGIAGELLSSYEKYLKENNAHVIELYCFERMEGFYRKKGYQTIGIRPKGYFKLKQCIMEKFID